MEVIEVIDLLSSPISVAQPTSNTTGAAVSSLFGEASAENTFRAAGNAHVWLCLSDDPDNDIPPPTPAVHNPTNVDLRNEDLRNENAGSRNQKSLDARNPKTSAALHSKRSSSMEADLAKGSRIASQWSDFFLPPENLNSTADLDEIFGTVPGPVMKRRRITPKTASMANTKSVAVKDKGIQRSLSGVSRGSKFGMMDTAELPGLRRSKTSILDESIIFAPALDVLSAPGRRKEKSGHSSERGMYNGDGDEYDEHITAYDRNHKSTSVTQCERRDTSSSSSDLDLPDIGIIASQVSSSMDPSFPRSDSKKSLAANTPEKIIQRKNGKVRKAQEKPNSKIAEKERKREAREDKAREKQMAAELAKVNTLRIDKKISTPEMIVDLPADVDTRLAMQVRLFLRPLDVECQEWSSPIPNVIKWRRKVEAIYDEELGYWIPVPKQIKAERHVMCIMVAKEFVDLAMGDEGRDLDAHVLRMKARFHDYEIIYLIEGLMLWMRKNRNVRNRQFTEAIRSHMAQGIDEEASTTRRSKKKRQPEYVDEDMVEDALLRLQVVHGVFIHHTATTLETAEWVVVFTQHISTIPYCRQRMTLNTAFCMESGQVKTGVDVPDTFIKMLQEVNRVTAPIAYGIAAEYPSASSLVHGFEKEGKDMLQGLRKRANREGAFVDREVGKKISRRLWNIFMGRDEGSTDI